VKITTEVLDAIEASPPNLSYLEGLIKIARATIAHNLEVGMACHYLCKHPSTGSLCPDCPMHYTVDCDALG